MENQPPTSAKRRGSKRILVVFGILVPLVLAGLACGWAYHHFSGHNMAGLEGTWRDTNDSKHPYEFQPNGDLDTWFGSKSWWNKIGWSATWRRDGQKITVRTDRAWDFVGQLDGGTIRGTMFMRMPNGAVDTGVPKNWHAEASAEWRRD